MYDGGLFTSPMMGKYCGDSFPPSHISSSNEILVNFETASFTTYNIGFQMKYNPTSKTFKTDKNFMKQDNTHFYHFGVKI